jgi:TetR/AcrR family transcriptional regulator, lmrAB and yxaGH operons repressor
LAEATGGLPNVRYSRRVPVEPSVADPELLEQLLSVFRQHGYDGASLSRLSERTGLQRSSLYHRFPAGKEQMALAVLQFIDRVFQQQVLGPLDGDRPPAERVRAMAAGLRDFYGDGRLSCVLDSLSLGGSDDRIRQAVKQSFLAWRDALARLAGQAGLGADEAVRRADEALVRIEGALVYSRVTGDVGPFTRTLDQLPALLTSA